MKVATWLPTFTDAPSRETVSLLVDWAARAEDRGFSSLWAVDHLLRITPNPTYPGLAWLDPLQSLACVASHTSLPLGTVYCGCLRNPVISAKEISTLMFLTDNRFILSPVLGWWGKEHELGGFPRSQRGSRTDEWLTILDLLLTQERVSYQGRYYEFEDVTIDPVIGRRPTTWVTGGAAHYEPDAVQDRASLKPRVIDRILRYDGWLVSAQSSPVKAAADWERLAAAAAERGDDPERLYVSHTNFVHVVETNDREKALEEQARVWHSHGSLKAGFDEYARKIFLVGTIDDIVASLETRAKMFGLEEIILSCHPGHEADQVELWARHLVPSLAPIAATKPRPFKER